MESGAGSVRRNIVDADEERARGKKQSRAQDLNWLLTGVQTALDYESATQNESAFQRLEIFCLQPMSRRGSFGKLVGGIAA
jgi:hypothetical protein